MVQPIDLYDEQPMPMNRTLVAATLEDTWFWPTPMAERADINQKLFFGYNINPLPSARRGNAMNADDDQEGISKGKDYFCQSNQTSGSEQDAKAALPGRTDLRRYSTSGPRPHECGQCPRTFARRHDLERHSRVHTGAKPYICPCCYKAFPRSDARGRHFRNEAACRHGPQVLAFIKKHP
ncbi:hypothetical protein BX666DRAFT_1912268 [Dichotomocladium elegans]|nr:hypothetical protein BX666DRAFT_1912268 [Dichotomocladium elegans]